MTLRPMHPEDKLVSPESHVRGWLNPRHPLMPPNVSIGIDPAKHEAGAQSGWLPHGAGYFAEAGR